MHLKKTKKWHTMTFIKSTFFVIFVQENIQL